MRAMTYHSLKSENLRLVVGDNEAGTTESTHQAGYNGLWSLTHTSRGENAFVPFYAGFNLEHIFNGQTTYAREDFFEPRVVPMALRIIDEKTVELHQAATPIAGVKSVTRFRLRGADQIEFEFTATPTKNVWPDGYLGFFWASYMNAPEDKSMYLRGGQIEHGNTPYWMQFCTQAHGRDSSVCHRSNRRALPFSVTIPRCLFQSISPQVWDEPAFYGNVGEMTLLTVFGRDTRIRFSHSPSGGGQNPDRMTTNPAWDFQWILENPEVGRDYTLRAVMTYRKAMTRSQILDEIGRGV